MLTYAGGTVLIASQFEYTINQGIAPTLVYPVSGPDQHWLMSKIIKSIRDYYPLWQVRHFTLPTYNTFGADLAHAARIPDDCVPFPFVHHSRPPPVARQTALCPSNPPRIHFNYARVRICGRHLRRRTRGP